VVRTGGRDDLLLQSSAGLFACDPATGRQRWAYKGGLSTIPTPVAGKGMIFVFGGGVVALRPPVDAGDPKVAWQSNKLQTSYNSILYYRDRVYSVNSVGVLTCAGAADGQVLWQQ